MTVATFFVEVVNTSNKVSVFVDIAVKLKFD